MSDKSIELKKFFTAVEQAGDSIFITNNKGIIEYVNPAFEKLTGYTSKEAIGKTPRIVKSGLQSDGHYKELWGTILAGKPFRSIVIDKKKNGELFYADHTITPIKNDKGKVTNFIGIWRDISEYKEIEKRKDEFIGIASHELKTPVTIIKVYADVLLKRLAKQTDKKDLYIISKITSQVDALTSLVRDLLDIQHIEEGKFELKSETIKIGKLIERILQDFKYANQTHKFIVNGTLNRSIIGDKERITQVFMNLLTNAVKYSPKGKTITIGLEEKDKEVMISVKDEGPGIPKSKHEKIFDRYYRAEKTNHASGFGIGLYVASDIVKKHGGRIWVESTGRKGSTFYFTLPL